MNALPLLIELRTEELPPKSLARLGTAWAQGVHQALVNHHLTSQDAVVQSFATPRRLAVLISTVLPRQEDRWVERKGPSLKAGLTADGMPTPALQGFARSCGVSIEQLERVRTENDHGHFLYRSLQTGAPLEQLLPELIHAVLRQLPVAKVMRWGAGTAEFVRPVHGLVALHGTQVLPLCIMGLAASNQTLGHRFLSQGMITLERANAYEAVLETRGHVLAALPIRRQRIDSLLHAAAGADQLLSGPDLLDEVTALVEWPVVYEGHFDPAFLEVPQECLILSMQQHQKYFPLGDAEGRLLPRFLLVSNLATPTPEAIIQGNERVLRARLADARFFYQQDKKTPLKGRLHRLEQVVYHQKLGSVAQRCQRLSHLAGIMASALGLSSSAAQQAAHLMKADLVSDMVGEFPELQGVMGGYYARHDGEPEAIACAIEEHYHPRFAGDTLPSSDLGTVVSLADKLETLSGMYGLGQIPTGDRDPYGLRRATLGILRILIEKSLPLELPQLLSWTWESFPAGRLDEQHRPSLQNFILDRLRGYLRDQGYEGAVIEAVLFPFPARIDQLPARLQALSVFRTTPAAVVLCAAHKRIRNLLKKSAPVLPEVLHSLAPENTDPAETALHQTLLSLQPQVQFHLQHHDYTAALETLAHLHDPVARFFADVMVLCEDLQIRTRRLTLLRQVEIMMDQVGDLSCLSV
ncbi:MAG: glycine--tRNA ligase subunit beta [Ferrovum sp.]|nr:glycine--tRNA ligase subunit beta [Ferrovum sp.]NDU87026.1 glycine--tRNA ligase subunit beta [Ferrovum sp.]